MYCPQCGLRNSKSNICKSCGENLESGKNYIKHKKYHLPIFYIILLAMGVTYFSGYYNLYYWPFTIFFILCFILLGVYEPIKSDLNKNVNGPNTSQYCPKCENNNYNKKYCIKCGYNLEDVLGYFETYRNDIEMNKKYVRIYPKIYLEHNEGLASRLSSQTFTLDKIENLRLSSCETLLSNKPCLIFDYIDKKCKGPAIKQGNTCILKVKIDDKDEYKMNRIINTGFYDK
jgi:hypothetical protein